MCGIAGFVSSRESAESRSEAIRRMCAAMVHRGPDDEGYATIHEASLGMRRLAIFDPAHGHQPMQTADGRYTLVFNGAIYNHRELRSELEQAGFRFATRCDTEVLLMAFACWQEKCLPRLRGMFAFAIWDDRERRLVFARGPFGIKPLYYHWRNDGSLILASELDAVLASRALTGEIDPLAVTSYLSYLAVPAPQTIYRRVRCLRPGQVAVWQDGQLAIRSYHTWREPSANPSVTPPDRTGFVEELRTHLEDTVRAHSLADVPVGAFLSGGLDSGAIVALMARQSQTRLKTFTLVFDEREFSEQNAARRIARHVGTDHHEQVVTGAMVLDRLPTIIRQMDQPTGDGINTYFASALAAASGVKAVVSGLGGDELFGGYPSFRQLPHIMRWLPLWRSLPNSWRQGIVHQLRTRRTVRSLKLADFLAHARDLNELASLQRTVLSESVRLPLLDPETRRQATRLGPMHPMLDDFAFELQATGPLRTISAWEMQTYMADVLLSDSDKFSMRHSIELRTPYVDQRLVRWLWSQPEDFVFKPVHRKQALADAVADLLPPPEQHATKIGFLLPFPVWIRGVFRPFLDDIFSDGSLRRCPWLDAKAVQTAWHEYQKSTDARNWSRIWSLAMLIAFAHRRPA
jgi:asparagine synthase (glutamine-hydrolysing)